MALLKLIPKTKNNKLMENTNKQINERVTCGCCSFDPNNKDHVIDNLKFCIEQFLQKTQELRNEIEVLKSIKDPSNLTAEIKQLKDYIQTLELAEFYRSEK